MTRKLGQALKRIKKDKQTRRKPRHQFGYMPTAANTKITDVDCLADADIDTTTQSLRHAYGYGGDDE